jgi:phenylacetate-CoA ligase
MRSVSSSIVRKLIFPLWMALDHPRCGAYLREFERTQFLELSALEALQLGRLQRLLTHAYQQCPFYRRRMDQIGLDPSRLTSRQQVSALPVLTKTDIQENGADLLARHFPQSERVRNQTGGSTGSPLQFYVDKERFDSRKASTIRHNAWAGLRPGDWCATLWGARLDQHLGRGLWDWCRNNFLYRTIELNTSRISSEDWRSFVAALRRKRPRFLIAYTQSAVLFAEYIRERAIEDIRFQSIITTAEVLLPGQRELLERTFQGRVFNRYGCREVSVIASECECHQGMHVNAEALLLEVVPDHSIPRPGGRIVITDLLNLSMPLIRYEVGDVGALAERPCTCGRRLPLLEDVQGRTTDFLTLPDGCCVSGPALTLVVADMADIRQVQFIQKSPECVVVRVVPGRDYGAHTDAELRRRLAHYLNDTMGLRIEQVDHIASELSGKYRFVISEVPPGFAVRGAATAGGGLLE